MKLSHEKRNVVLLAVFMLAAFFAVNFHDTQNPRLTIIDGDGSGLYAYLPAIFVYHTVDFTPLFHFEKSRRPPGYTAHNYHTAGQVMINKFWSGTALLELPFFLLAWLLSLLLGLPPDGYNILFQYAVALAAVFWVSVGLVFTVRLLRLYNIPENSAWIIVLTGFLGTNLLHYTFIQPAASHAYSFSLTAFFLYYMKRVFISYEKKSLFLAAFVLGLITLVRPVDILIVVALPFLASAPETFIRTVRQKAGSRDVFITFLLFLVALSPQLIINMLQTGKPLIWGYRNEGFYWTHPEIFKFLFSYRKGWFVYTPYMLLLFPALFALWKRSKYEMWTFAGFLLIVVYVFSSWWNWLYGDSFGMRPMVDFYALFFLVTGILFHTIRKKIWKTAVAAFVGMVVFLNIIQTYQYARGIIHPDSMTREAYWYVFLKTDDIYRHVIGDEDEYFYGTLSGKPFFETRFEAGKETGGWSKPRTTEKINGSTAVKLDAQNIFSPAYTFKDLKSLKGKDRLYAVLSAEYLEPHPNAVRDALFVAEVNGSNGKRLFYKAFRIKRLPDDKTGIWRNGHIGFKLPPVTPATGNMKFYIWNKNGQTFYLRQITLKLFTYGRK